MNQEKPKKKKNSGYSCDLKSLWYIKLKKKNYSKYIKTEILAFLKLKVIMAR